MSDTKPREWTLRLDTLIINNLTPSQQEYTVEGIRRPIVKVIERSAYDQVIKERDRLLEVNMVLRVMCGDLRDNIDELRGDNDLTAYGSNFLHSLIDRYAERAEELMNE
jgi:hypothetical protein